MLRGDDNQKNDTPAASSYRQSMKIHWLSWGIWYSSIDYDAVIYLEISEVSLNQKIPDMVWVDYLKIGEIMMDSVLGLSPFCTTLPETDIAPKNGGFQ